MNESELPTTPESNGEALRAKLGLEDAEARQGMYCSFPRSILGKLDRVAEATGVKKTVVVERLVLKGLKGIKV